jgi:hypothetical protein
MGLRALSFWLSLLLGIGRGPGIGKDLALTSGRP